MDPDWDEYIRENLRYDPETGLLWWTKQRFGVGPLRAMDKPVGSLRPDGYLGFCARKGAKKRGLLCHRVAWFLHTGEWPDNQIDHANNTRADNRIVNLRPADYKENGRNKLKQAKPATSQYKGVGWHKLNVKWVSRIKVGGRCKQLGYFNTEEEAALAYDKAAKELFGEYANLNFPERAENVS